MKLLHIITLIILPFAASADYLITSKNGPLRKHPLNDSQIAIKIPEGTYLLLLDSGKIINEYYHVQSSLFEDDGWFSMHFVRRYHGDPPQPIKNFKLVEEENEKVEVRVLDVGPGLCTVIKLPHDKYVIYDAGYGASKTLEQLRHVIPFDSRIELLVLSHTDKDHIDAAENILEFYKVKKLLWTGYNPKETELFTSLQETVADMPDLENINLQKEDSIITPGVKLKFGKATLTFLCGFNKPLAGWNLKENAEKVNAVSIVMKLEYFRHSVLFCGDAVGWKSEREPLIATEQYLVQHAAHLLASTILIAPHHGADNGNSDAFIQKVAPRYVVFSAGHKHAHPRTEVANRYLHRGVPLSNIFRTDRGDDETMQKNGFKEWAHQRKINCKDPRGDDDVQIELFQKKQPGIRYVNTQDGCTSPPDRIAPGFPLNSPWP